MVDEVVASRTPAPFNYDAVAHRYDDHRRAAGTIVDRLVEITKRAGAQRVLEIGPGTGNNTAAFLERYPCRFAALERSRGMLDRARTKRPDIPWIHGDGMHIPVIDGAFDMVFAFMVLHHIEDLPTFFRECVRVTDNGHAAFVTASHSFIRRHPLNQYFPSFAAVDLARFPDIPSVVKTMKTAGFDQVETIDLKLPPQPVDNDYVSRVAGKFLSTYDLLPPGEFEQGLDALRADVAREGALGVAVEWESVIIHGTVHPS